MKKKLNKLQAKIPGHIKIVLFNLKQKPLTKEEIFNEILEFHIRLGVSRKKFYKKNDIKFDLEKTKRLGIIKEEKGLFTLTPTGEKIADRIEEEIIKLKPKIDKFLSLKYISFTTIIVHIFTSVIKITFGLLSRSAGLLSDGFDNIADTIASFLVWFGIKLKKERLASLLVIIMMYISTIGVFFTAGNKFLKPEPVEEGFLTFFVTFFVGLIMLILSMYQYYGGKNNTNFAVMSQSIDSKNHFYVSLLVCFGIIASFLAKNLEIDFLYYIDAIAAIFIGLMILISAYDLTKEYLKKEEEEVNINHFIEKAIEKKISKMIYEWLVLKISNKEKTFNSLSKEFKKDFCQKTPLFINLTGFGYVSKDDRDLEKNLKKFLKEGKINLNIRNGKYSLNP